MPNLQSIITEFTSSDDEKAEYAANDIATYGIDAIPVLSKFLTSSSVDIRWWATRSLALIANPQIAALRIESLRDKDLSVRQCAALALKKQPSNKAIPELVLALGDEDRLLGRLAANTLIAVGPPAILALGEILTTGASAARLETARALALIEDPEAIPILFEVLNDDSALVRFWAEEGLE